MTGEPSALERRRSPRMIAFLVLQSLVFAASCWSALAISSEFFVGPYVAAWLFLPLTVAAVGTIRVRNGVAGGRALAVAGNLGVALTVASHLLTTPATFLRVDPLWLLLAPIVGAVGAGAVALVPREALGRVVRRDRDRAVLVALVLLHVAAVSWSILRSSGPVLGTSTGATVDLVDATISRALPRFGLDLAVLSAWWFGARWPLLLSGLVGAVTIALNPQAFATDPIGPSLATVATVISIWAGLRGPRWDADRSGSPWMEGRSSVSAVWIAIGALLWPPFVLFGTFPLVSDFCDVCGPSFPGAELLYWIGMAGIGAVPLLALTAGYGGGIVRGRALWALLAFAIVLLTEIGAGIAGVNRFAFLGIAAPAGVLVGIGAFSALRDPAGLRFAGRAAGLAGGAVAVAWCWSALGGTFQTRAPEFLIGSFIQAAVAAVAIAHESHRARIAVVGAARSTEPSPQLAS